MLFWLYSLRNRSIFQPGAMSCLPQVHCPAGLTGVSENKSIFPNGTALTKLVYLATTASARKYGRGRELAIRRELFSDKTHLHIKQYLN